MEHHSFCLARIAKNISYFLVPVFLIMLIASIGGLMIMDSDIRIKEAENYYETKLFSEQYFNDTYRYYSITYPDREDLETLDYYNTRYDDYQEGVDIEGKEGVIYYDQYDENNNFRYIVIDVQEGIARTNLEHTMRTDSIEEIKQVLSENTLYWNYENGNVDTSITNLKLEDIRYTYQFENMMQDESNLKIYTVLLNDLPYNDEYAISKLGYDTAMKANNAAPYLIPVSIVALVVLTIVIIHGIGRNARTEEIHLNRLDKWSLEIVLCIGFFIMLMGFACFTSINSNIRTIIITGITIGSIIIYLGCILLLETIVKRMKTHTVWKSTLLYAIGHNIKQLIVNRKITTKLILFYGGFCILAFILTGIIWSSNSGGESFFSLLLLITIGVLTFWYLFKKLKEFQNIQMAIKSIYEGNTNIHLNPNEMKGVLKELSIYVNDIAGGLSNAVQQNLKSERLKTELITNVSHDIKTPLTSIINYVDLLKKEKMPNEKATEYLMILDNKSQRLKKLTEDLVEASKASSGNIKLKMEKINVNELVKQVSGEFEDRFKTRGLEEIMTLPEEPVFIQADGRYMYRVLENLYSNASKYAMENTRVYLDVISMQKSVVIQMKNVSKEKLNISTDELMQRFVRGDSSRNTEGSGLRTFYCI